MLENLILPMSFPWAHSVGPVIRTIPRDIDEMPAIQMIDDAEHELCSLRNNNFDLACRYSRDTVDQDDGADFRAVARRAGTPGVVELLTCAKPLVSSGQAKAAGSSSILLKDPVVETVPAQKRAVPITLSHTNSKAPADLSYQVFKQIQDSKRRKLEAGLARIKTSMISFKVGSTSSRPKLFNTSDSQGRMPLLLPAELPQDFRPIVKSRHKHRVPPGRSTLVWMEKINSNTSHRVSFKSYITNEKVDGGLQKRPRDVLVGIRVNGKLLSSPNITFDDIKRLKEGGSSKHEREGKSSYTSKYVAQALEEACVRSEQKLSTRQASMDTEVFIKRILSAEAKNDPADASLKCTVRSLIPVYSAPRIECFPTEDGLVRTVCSSPGILPPTNVQDLLNEVARGIPGKICTVCWRDVSLSAENVSECPDCGVTVHRKCCHSDDAAQTPLWLCNICSVTRSKDKMQISGSLSSQNNDGFRRSTRTNEGIVAAQGKDTPCCLCPHKGGSMSIIKLGNQSFWAHDVCRTWSDSFSDPSKTKNNESNKFGLICSLCGTHAETKGGVATRLASGCSVSFHPMCALLFSKCEASKKDGEVSQNGSNQPVSGTDRKLENQLAEDKFLCCQYSLRFAKCSIPGEKPSASRPSCSSVLPVCFCGIHNPQRDRSLYGLYPGGKFIDEQVIRVPPKNKAGTNAAVLP